MAVCLPLVLVFSDRAGLDDVADEVALDVVEHDLEAVALDVVLEDLDHGLDLLQGLKLDIERPVEHGLTSSVALGNGHGLEQHINAVNPIEGITSFGIKVNPGGELLVLPRTDGSDVFGPDAND